MKKKYNVSISINTETFINGKLNDNAFNHESKGYWMGSSDNYNLDDKDKAKLGISFTPAKAFTVQDKTLYRFPKLDLPRQKVDLLKEKYNCKVIRDINKADINVVSDQLFDNLFDYEWNTSVKVSLLIKLLQEAKEKDFISESGLSKCREMLHDMGPDAMIKLDFPYNYSRNSTAEDNLRNVFQVLKEKLFVSDDTNSRDIILHQDNVINYNNIVNSKAIIVYDTDIINIIDEQLAVLENTELDTIVKMVKNDGKENRTLALEMLANCNIDKSFDIVSHVFYWYFDWLKDTSNWNTVNVKALRKRLKKYQGGCNATMIYAYNNYIECLIEDKKLTKFALDNTREKLYHEVLRDIGGNNANVFSISLDSVKLKDTLTDNIIKKETDEQEIRHEESDIRDNFTI